MSHRANPNTMNGAAQDVDALDQQGQRSAFNKALTGALDADGARLAARHVNNLDLTGTQPESWLCVDCGINTAPGCSTRAELEQAFNAMQESTKQTFDDRSEIYILRDAVWQAAGIEPMGGCLCISCLEQRLDRRLKPKDFLRGHPLNTLPGTPRLMKRQKRRQ